jgi:hypothetical protein
VVDGNYREFNESILWRTLGTLDYNLSSPGTNPVSFIGDGDVLETFLAGRKRFAKQVINNTVTSEGALEVVTNYNSAAGIFPDGSTMASLTVAGNNNIPSGGVGVSGVLSSVTVTGGAGSGGNLCFFANATIGSEATCRCRVILWTDH